MKKNVPPKKKGQISSHCCTNSKIIIEHRFEILIAPCVGSKGMHGLCAMAIAPPDNVVNVMSKIRTEEHVDEKLRSVSLKA